METTTPDKLFDTVEVEISLKCNRKCPYCPVSILPLPDLPLTMADDVYSRILAELKRLDFKGRFSYHFYNEPLLRKDLERYIRWAKAEIPQMFQLLFTNGDALTEARYNSLMDAGIDYILITSHSLKSHPERPKQLLQFPDELVLSNRAGTLIDLPKPTADLLAKPCYAPSELLIITVNGGVVLCCEDSKRELTFGNVMQEPLDVIWNSPDLVDIRNKLKENRYATHLCRACSNQSYTEPGKAAFSEPSWNNTVIEFQTV